MTRLVHGAGSVADLARRLVDPRLVTARWWVVALLFFPILTLLAGLFAQAFGPPEPSIDLAGAAAQLGHPLVLVGAAAFTLVIGPLPEEVGWRGYLLDRMQTRRNALGASILVGLLHWTWHLPLFRLPGYSGAFHAIPPTPIHLLLVVLPTAILYTWVYNNTERSVLAVVLFHFSGNFSAELLRLSGEAETYRILLILVATVFIVSWWGRRHCVETSGPRSKPDQGAADLHAALGDRCSM
jgi:membrane protease YdiL (CAAX protease family)